MPRTPTPLGALLRGLAAGAVGTAAMDAVWYRRYRAGGGQDGVLAWETAAGLEGWDGAPPPAQVGRRLVEGFLQRTLPDSRARITTNAVHWIYGVAWGGLYGIAGGTAGPLKVYLGVPFGASVWSSGYVALPAAGLYKPIWRYDAATLGRDLSAHLVYGTVTAAAFALLSLL